MKAPSALVLALDKKSEDDDMDSEPSEASDDEWMDAGRALKAALASEDGKDVREAFEALVHLCKEY